MKNLLVIFLILILICVCLNNTLEKFQETNSNETITPDKDIDKVNFNHKEIMDYKLSNDELSLLLQDAKGEVGEKGTTGSRGKTGPVGKRGEKGSVGNRGPVGERGPQGPRGPLGPTGRKGPPGEVPGLVYLPRGNSYMLKTQGTLSTNQLCLENTCVTEQEFKDLLSKIQKKNSPKVLKINERIIYGLAGHTPIQINDEPKNMGRHLNLTDNNTSNSKKKYRFYAVFSDNIQGNGNGINISSKIGNKIKWLDWHPDISRKLGDCEGDCDRDSDCASGLKCFQRGSAPVPNCRGSPGARGADYCYNPSNNLSIVKIKTNGGSLENIKVGYSNFMDHIDFNKKFTNPFIYLYTDNNKANISYLSLQTFIFQ